MREIDKYMDTLMGILGKHCKKDPDQVRKDCDRDYFMSADEALKYGIIDKVLEQGAR